MCIRDRSMAIHQHHTGELTKWLLHIALSSLSDWHCCFSRSFSFYQILQLLFQFVLWHPSHSCRWMIYSCQGNSSSLPFLFLNLQPVCPSWLTVPGQSRFGILSRNPERCLRDAKMSRFGFRSPGRDRMLSIIQVINYIASFGRFCYPFTLKPIT